MKRVALISSVPPPMGGISKWTLRMLNSKLEKDWIIELVSDRIVGNRECFGDKIKYNYWAEIKRWAKVWITLFKTIKKKEVLVAHACPIATTQSMLVNIVSASIVKVCGKKHIIHFRCTVPNLINSKTQLFVLKVLCKLSDEIICLNSQTERYLNSVTKTPTVLIPNFVELGEIKANEIHQNVRTVLYVGGVTKEKGCDNIIDIARQYPTLNFRLVGLPSSEILEYGKDVQNVFFVGVKSGEDLFNEFQNADIFLFLSRFWGEGFSNALSEAMAAGLPCIVTNWAANADQIEHGRGGFVVQSDIVRETVSFINELESSTIRKDFSLYNIDKVKNQYSAEIILNKYVECYENLI